MPKRSTKKPKHKSGPKKNRRPAKLGNTGLKKSAGGIRLQKLLAERGYGSRRKMEAWIAAGRVSVDGKVATIGKVVTPENRIEVDGQSLREKVDNMEGRVLMYNKPEGELCTRSDPKRRPTVYKNLPKIRNARWVSVGRLDINTSGLLLFTTNGDLANKLMHPSSEITRVYRCRIYGEITKEDTKALLNGIEIDGETMRFDKIVYQSDEDKRNRWVHVSLKEGKNREVRKLWEAIECQVSRLTRIQYGSVVLPRDLRQGKYRNLTKREVDRLAQQIKVP